ncbi:hypothetical protein SLA2020_078160 [Shorea laevis]
MDNVLCDELLREIFTRLPASPSASLSVSLVCKRWLHLYRTSKTSLSLRFSPQSSAAPSLAALLAQYPFLSTLSVLLSDKNSSTAAVNDVGSAFFDHLLSVISSSCSNLKQLRFLVGPVSLFSLIALSRTCTHITSLTVSLSRPLFFNWVAFFSCLKDLSVIVCSKDGFDGEFDRSIEYGVPLNEELDAELGLETLCLTGVRSDDRAVGWLWRSCRRLRKLQLKSCESVGDGGSFSSFVNCVQGLQEVELRKCRSIVNGVLLKLAENCDSLNSLLVYDGGSREGLLEFISDCRCNMQKLDLRLPLDLTNDHLIAIAANFRGLSTLRLQSCCLVTGEGLKTLGIALSSSLEELAMINCDVVEREPGLLATLGQNLRMLKKLDLSYNEMLLDKEFVSMLASCNNLTELKLRGCRWLTGAAMFSMSKSCKQLKSIDIMNCCSIEAKAVELFLQSSPRLKQIQVDENKLSDAARTWLSHKFVEVIVC